MRPLGPKAWVIYKSADRSPDRTHNQHTHHKQRSRPTEVRIGFNCLQISKLLFNQTQEWALEGLVGRYNQASLKLRGPSRSPLGPIWSHLGTTEILLRSHLRPNLNPNEIRHRSKPCPLLPIVKLPRRYLAFESPILRLSPWKFGAIGRRSMRLDRYMRRRPANRDR